METEGLKKHLIKIYERHDFEQRGNKERTVDATMDEIARMMERMMDQLYEKIKRTRI